MVNSSLRMAGVAAWSMARFISRMVRAVKRWFRTALPRRLMIFPFVALFAGACAGGTAAIVLRTVYDALRHPFDALNQW
jgi:hypothetical protein